MKKNLPERASGIPLSVSRMTTLMICNALLYSLGVLLHWPTWGLMRLDVAANVVFLPASFLAGAIACRAARQHTRQMRRAWTLLGIGSICFGLGTVLWIYLTVVMHIRPFPSVADAGYLAFPLLLISAFCCFPRRATSRGELARISLDIAVMVVTAALFVWRFLLASQVADYSDNRLALVISFAYPVLDLVLLSLLLLLIFERRVHLPTASAFWLGAGLLFWISADLFFAILNAKNLYVVGGSVDALWMWGSVAFGLAAVSSLSRTDQSSASALHSNRWTRGLASPQLLGWLRKLTAIKAYLPYSAVLAGYGLLIWLHGDTSRAAIGVVWGGVGVTMLVVARQVLALHENMRLNGELRAWSETLELRVNERTRELAERTSELEALSGNLEIIVRHRTAELEASRVLLAHQAQHDALTGLPNRTLFEDRLQQAVAGGARRGTKVAVLFIDLDGFKLVNDTLGHAAGDELLCMVAERLRGRLRTTDTIARLGGDEFAVVLPDLQEEKNADMVARSLLGRLCSPLQIGGHQVQVGASIGVSLYPQDGPDAVTLQKHADVAMYRVKGSGKNDVRFFAPEMNAAAVERMELETCLHGALERGEFELHYQPQFDRNGHHLTGFEALLRWTHPELGPVSPARFVPILEETGQIVAVGAWVFDEACRQLAAWKTLFPGRELHMAVNVSPIQFAREEFVPGVEATLARHAVHPANLELELTEGMIVRDIAAVSHKMTQLRALGARVAIDDFGAGHSALSYLLRLPVDVLKIDRAFVQDLDRTPGAQRVVSAIVVLAHALGLEVVAEGVETQAQMSVLRDLGCERTQGFLLGRPIPTKTAQELIESCCLARLEPI